MPRQITVDELALRLREGQPAFLLDVRQPWEHDTARLPDSLLIPLGELGERWPELVAAVPPGSLIVAYCHHGVRSLSAAAILESHDLGEVVSLAGGIDAWSLRIDPATPRY
jgi:rhodanese-related sulfurtransferase